MKSIKYISLALVIMVSGCDYISKKTGLIWFPLGTEQVLNENYGHAIQAYQQNRLPDAVAYLQRADDEGYRNPFMLAELAKYNAATKNYDRALQYSLKAIEILQSDNIEFYGFDEMEMLKRKNKRTLIADAYSRHALILYNLNRNSESLSFVDKALDLDPQFTNAKDLKELLIKSK